jgi:glutamine synthetase
VASAGNDHRLGACEAPPVIISIYLGDELHAVVESIINGSNYTDPEKNIMRIGVDVLPPIPKDTTDRNRTSPLAFTGNKFEFRMLGSSQSIADPNIALNTIMAEELSKFADILENAEDFDATLHQLVSDTFKQHQRILFNGNGYSEEWSQEAERRGLSNLRSTTQAIPRYVSDKNIGLVTKHGIFTENEFRARNEIQFETYRKILNIEAKATADIAIRQILPAVSKYSAELSNRIHSKSSLGCKCNAERNLLENISEGIDRLYERCDTLQKALSSIPGSSIEAANYCNDIIAPAMDAVRREADALELITDKAFWPFPTYSDILFY